MLLMLTVEKSTFSLLTVCRFRLAKFVYKYTQFDIFLLFTCKYRLKRATREVERIRNLRICFTCANIVLGQIGVFSGTMTRAITLWGGISTCLHASLFKVYVYCRILTFVVVKGALAVNDVTSPDAARREATCRGSCAYLTIWHGDSKLFSVFLDKTF